MKILNLGQVEYFHKQESSLQLKVEELKATLVKYQVKKKI